MVDWKQVRYFNKYEWGPRAEKVADELILLIDKIRATANIGIVIHCSWADGGHSEKSYHYTGQAADFHFVGRSYHEQYCILREFRQIGGLGFYPEWNQPGWHIDLRDGFLQWVRLHEQYIYGPMEMSAALRKGVKA